MTSEAPVQLADEAATAALGVRIARILVPGDVLALSGDLGAGKTTLARAILGELGLAGEAPSPSYALVIPYAPPETRIAIAHVDLYRLESPEAAEELGLDELRDDGALIIEWPERLGERLWGDALKLRLDRDSETARRLTATVPPSWEERWSRL